MIGCENEKNRMCIKAFRKYMTMDLIGTLERIEQFLLSGNRSVSDDSNIDPDSDTFPPSDGESDSSDKSQSQQPSQIALRDARIQRRRERDSLLMRRHRTHEGDHAAVRMRGRAADRRKKGFKSEEVDEARARLKDANPEKTSDYSWSDRRKSREAKHKRIKIRNLDEAIENALERLRMSRKDETDP